MGKLTWLTLVLAAALWCPDLIGQDDVNLEGLSWIPDRNDILYSAILVPENHDDPEGKKIQITYVIVKARNTLNPGFPVIFFSGGPGGNSLDREMFNFLIEDPMRDKRDLIFFDQRGIGYSSPLPDMASDAFKVMAGDVGEEEELALMTAMITEYKKKCVSEGIHPEYYNSLQSARDVGTLFKQLGYKKYNLLGISYGTRLGRVVQDMFPDFIHSAVFDSPAPLGGDFLLSRLENFSLALERIFSYCETNPECYSQYPALPEDYLKAISILEQTPLKIQMKDTGDFFINPQDGIYLLRRLLYQADAREKAPELIHAFINGGGEVIGDVIELELRMTVGLNLSMLLSVEKFENFNPEITAGEISTEYRKYPLIPVKLGFFDAFYQAGMEWHHASLPVNERHFMESKIPTLIFVNQFDPVTPPENGYLFKEKLPRGTLLILDEGGHGDGNVKCKDNVISAFMDNPEILPDISCLHLYTEN